MSISLLVLEQNVLNVLNEAFNSTLGDLPTGAGGSATIPTLTPASSSVASTMKSLLNEGAAELARTCIPVPDTATLSWMSGTRTNPLLSFAAAAGSAIWAVRGVKFGSETVGLRYCDRSALERSDPDWMVTSTAAPVYWYMDGAESIGLYPRPNSTATATIDGFAVPTLFTSDSSTASWIHDDLTHLLVWYAAARLALKNAEDGSLASRIAAWQGHYDRGRDDLWQQIDPRLRKAHFPNRPLQPAS